MESIGQYLRRHREENAMSMEEVSRATRIPLGNLERLENDHFDDLPGEVFVRGFLKADAIVTLFTEELGKLAALARGARKSTRRFAAALEPMHTIRVTLDERPGAELCALREAVVIQPRAHILGDLSRMNAAGQALRWVRAGSPQRTQEPEVWAEIEALLERLDDPADSLPAQTHLM